MEYSPEAAIHLVVSKFHTGDLSGEFDVECSFEILSTAKKDNASVSTIADEEENYHWSGQNVFCPFSFFFIESLPYIFKSSKEDHCFRVLFNLELY